MDPFAVVLAMRRRRSRVRGPSPSGWMTGAVLLMTIGCSWEGTPSSDPSDDSTSAATPPQALAETTFACGFSDNDDRDDGFITASTVLMLSFFEQEGADVKAWLFHNDGFFYVDGMEIPPGTGYLMTGTLELDRHLLLAREFYGHRLEIDMPFREDYYLAYSEIRFDTDYYVKPCTFHAIDYIYLTPN